MIESLLILWRETMEAALIVGVLLTYLGRTGRRAGMRYVWLGTAVAVLAAIACAVGSRSVPAALNPDRQELLEAGVMAGAAGLMSWMMIWMHRHVRVMRGELQHQADRVIATGRLVGLAAIAFVAVFREGLETVLFLWGIIVQRGDSTSALSILAGGLIGVGLAMASTWLLLRGLTLFQLPILFHTTGALMLLVAAGLLTSTVNTLVALGYLPPIVPQVWNSSRLIRDGSPVGALLAILLGYRSQPSLLEVLAFNGYVVPMAWVLHRVRAAHSGSPPREGPAGPPFSPRPPRPAPACLLNVPDEDSGIVDLVA